jgi:nicotinamidase-related amidase
MSEALVLIDLQNDYFPGGAFVLDGSDAALANAVLLLADFRRARRPVIHVQHVANRPDAGFFLPGTAGVRIHPAVAPGAGESVIEKHFPNSFRATALLETLRAIGVERLLIAGMMTHQCIDATTRAAWDLGFVCRIAGDACATRALTYAGEKLPAAQVHAVFLAALSGFYASVAPTAAILAVGEAPTA